MHVFYCLPLSLHIYILISLFYSPFDTVQILSIIVFTSVVFRKICHGGYGDVQEYKGFYLDSDEVAQVLFCVRPGGQRQASS